MPYIVDMHITLETEDDTNAQQTAEQIARAIPQRDTPAPIVDVAIGEIEYLPRDNDTASTLQAIR